MDLEQLAHLVRARFRVAIVGYVILAAGLIAAVSIAYSQGHSIKSNRQHIGELAVCDAPAAVRQELGATFSSSLRVAIGPDELRAQARRRYVAGEIEAEDLEAELDRIGREFPGQ